MPRGKNAYAAELMLRKQMGVAVIQTWTAQLCLDCMTLVLNDPEIMGKDRFGRDRLRKIGDGFNALFSQAYDAFTTKPNASHVRAQLDRELEKIVKEDFLPWNERYDNWLDRGI